MEYSKFKNHLYKRLVNEYGFTKENKEYYYDNDEVRIFFNLGKSQYSNAAIINVWVTVKELCRITNTPIPNTYHFAHTAIRFMSKPYWDLDIHDNFNDIDRLLEEFFVNVFPKIRSASDLREYYISNKSKSLDENLNKFLKLSSK